MRKLTMSKIRRLLNIHRQDTVKRPTLLRHVAKTPFLTELIHATISEAFIEELTFAQTGLLTSLFAQRIDTSASEKM